MANDLNRSIKIYLDNSEAMTSADQLQARIGELEKKLLDLQTAGKGNSEQAKKIQKELTAQATKYEKYKREVQDTERVLRNLSGATYKELLKAKKDIDAQLRTTTRNTDLYNKRLEVQKAISKELLLVQKDMRTEIGCQASSWGRAADWINKYMGIIGSGMAALTGITMAFAKFRDERDKLESSSANLKALTGLDDESVEKLENAAKRLSTTVTKEGVRIRQSAVEIDDSFAIIGSQRPELLQNAEALEKVTQDAIYLSIASKDKLEPAAKALTTVMNQMNLGAENSRRIINAIAAGSQAGAGNIQYITDAFEKSGTTANLMNIQLEQHIGLIEAVAPKYSEAALAGNSLDKVLLKMKEKGIGYKDGVFDLSRAIDEISTRFKKGESAASLFGAEHAKMAEILVMNKADIERYTAAVTDTNKAVEQAQINSDTNESKRAQARNKMNLLAIDLMEKLNPAIIGTMNQTVHWTGKLVAAAGWISKNTGLILVLITNLGLYTAAIKLSSYWKTVSNGATLRATVTEKAHMIQLKANTVATKAHAAAHLLLSGNVRTAMVAVKGLMTTLGINPITAAIVAITALSVGIYKIWENSTKSARAIKEMNKEIATEQAEANALFDALQRSNTGTRQRKELIDEINSKYGQYLEYQLTEKSTTEDIAKALETVNGKLKENIVLKTIQKEKEQVNAESLEKQADLMDKMREKSNLGQFVTDAMLRDVKRITDEGLKYGRSWTQAYNDVITSIDYYYGARGKVDKEFWVSLQGYINETYSTASKLDKISKRYSPFLPEKPANELPEVVVTAPSKQKPDTYAVISAEKEKKILESRLKEVDRFIAEKKLRYTQDYTDGLMQYEGYQRKLESLELMKLNKQLEVYKIGSDERKKIEQLILDFRIKLMDQSYQEYLKNLDKEAEADKQRKTQKEKLYKGLNDDLQTFVQRQNEKQEELAKKQEETDKRRAQTLLDFSAQAGQILGESLVNSETSFAEAMGNILLLTLDTLRQVVTMSIAETTIRNVSKLGFLGLAKAAAEIALINVAFGALKGLIKKPSTSNANSGVNEAPAPQTGQRVVSNTTGWYDGGFTGYGGTMEVAGPVHREEYVTPAWQLRDPVSMNHVLALESIRNQRTNANPLPVPGFANGGYAGRTENNNTVDSDDNKELSRVLSLLYYLLTEMRAKGLKAYVVYSDIEAAKNTLDKSKKIGGK